MGDKNLTIHLVSSTYSNNRNIYSFCNDFSKGRWNSFKDHGKNTGIFQSFCIINNTFCSLCIFPLHFKSAKGACSLGRKSDVTLDRNSCFYNSFNRWSKVYAAFKLDNITAAFFHQSAGIDNGFADRGIITHKWHVSHNKCIFTPPNHSFDMVYHMFHGNLYCTVKPHYHHTKRVTHKDNIHACLICH